MDHDAKLQVIKMLFDDGCHGCVNHWLIPNLGWILFIIIFVLPFLLFAVVAALFGPPRNSRYPNGYHGRGGVHSSHYGGESPFTHGQEVSVKTLQEALDGSPGRTGYYDSYTREVVNNKSELTDYAKKEKLFKI
jgi:hypothetical protein